MAEGKPSYLRGGDLFSRWQNDVLTGEGPTRWPVGDGVLAGFDLGPGRLTLLGGAPGAGKTAFAMQAAFEAVRRTADLRALVANVEMPAEALLDRQLARLAEIDAGTVRDRQIGEQDAERLPAAFDVMEQTLDRLAFLTAPFTLSNVALAADDFGATLLVLDYVQRIGPGEAAPDKRSAINRTMDLLRRFCDAGCGLLVVAAVGRSKDAKGRATYSGEHLGLASFRESSELEFGADSAYVLVPAGPDSQEVTLRHLKSRYGECRDLVLRFERQYQRFSDPLTAEQAALADAIRDYWRQRDGNTGNGQVR